MHEIVFQRRQHRVLRQVAQQIGPHRHQRRRAGRRLVQPAQDLLARRLCRPGHCRQARRAGIGIMRIERGTNGLRIGGKARGEGAQERVAPGIVARGIISQDASRQMHTRRLAAFFQQGRGTIDQRRIGRHRSHARRTLANDRPAPALEQTFENVAGKARSVERHGA